MEIRPITPPLLVTELAEWIAATQVGARVRVAVDGPEAADPHGLADALVAPLRVLGRPVFRVRATDFLRPASLRFELGRRNPDSFYTSWLDESGLRREVLDPAGPGGSGQVLPSLWNAETDRATRAGYVSLAPNAAVVVSGALLLGGGLPFDLTVHLAMSSDALARRTAVDQAWTLPAFTRYAEEVCPTAFADVVVRVDDPRRPALVRR